MTILNRLHSAESGSRELDAEIGIAAGINFAQPHAYDGSITYGSIDSEGDRSVPSANSDNYMLVRHYTTSIDAALSLVERMLPGWVVADLSQDSTRAGDPWGCKLAYYCGSDPTKNRTAGSPYNHERPPLAILTALFTALEAKDTTP